VAIGIRTSKDRQHNGQKKRDKQRSSKHKTKDRVTRSPLKIGGELTFSGRVSSSCSTGGTRRNNLVTNPVISHECRNMPLLCLCVDLLQFDYQYSVLCFAYVYLKMNVIPHLKSRSNGRSKTSKYCGKAIQIDNQQKST
jgi:hypothetical protein